MSVTSENQIFILCFLGLFLSTIDLTCSFRGVADCDQNSFDTDTHWFHWRRVDDLQEDALVKVGLHAHAPQPRHS